MKLGVPATQPFEAQAQPCAEVALTAGTPNFSTLSRSSSKPVKDIGHAAQTLSGGTIMALIR